ncbi:P-loop containing nucleoside triphosphate hydrolases superfamily protein [Perilla frutescens var. hirtella]|nr:P-loop containing nucleoside triphosphate hydrolases superfamily protein [Perilla frutescens var. hirtella]KAH6811279.1 P-loop containing nucleoside triphosphate hydrolases superfamily protein [Perilla frutescens var. frutescens]
MTRVYGTGVYDFRRHRVAEYPVAAGAPPVSDNPAESRPVSNVPSSITLSEIQRDRLTRIAAENWVKTADSDPTKPFSPDLVKEIYRTELTVSGGVKPVPLQRVMILEVSQYLENYLLPNFTPETASFEHVMSMILMVNEKFRENVAAWICFYNRKDMFKAFLERVLRLKEGRSLTISEKTNYLLFMINAFQSLEDEIVSERVMRLASLECWHSLSYGRFQMELCLNENLIKKWRRIAKRARDATKRGETFDPTTMLEANFLRNLIEEFLEVLDSEVFSSKSNGNNDPYTPGSEYVDDACVLYCERFMEFLIDLLSQLPTRRLVRPLVADVAVVAKCHLSSLYRHEKGKLFGQLVDLLQYYEGFEIDDHQGRQMTDDEVLQAHYRRLQAFQLLAFKKIPKLRELALANIGAINRRADLAKKLSILSAEELRDLVCAKLKLVSEDDPWSKRIDFLIEVMVSFFEKQQSQKEAINALPLYPNEQIMWDESLVPSINYSGEGCLALPKLNLQFLTLHDYLLRNFNLFRLESTYEIREDIQESVPHLLAYTNNEGETAFRGWSRMAVPIKEFKIAEVKQPNIGEVKPSAVTAEVTFSISSYKAQIRSEWNSLKEHDVLFLLSIRHSFEPLSAEEAEKATVPEKLGLQYVRGCEIIEIRDEEGILMNDFTGRIKRDEWKPPKGELRTVTVALDTAQYHMDVSDIAEKGADDVYSTFNILVRRKPKENNFKAILESIRDLMNETCIVPDWLHDIFLGYGDPSAAQWINMPDLLEKVDFKDTFLDTAHVKESFPNYQVRFVKSDGTDNCDPCPPFRIKFPTNPEGRVHFLPGNESSTRSSNTSSAVEDDRSDKLELLVESYIAPDPGPYPQDQPKQNSVRFTPTQVGAIISGIQPGLTMVVGPPGTGKTDTAVQILNVLYHNCPSQRTLIITHSNQALNDLFEKIMERDVPARYLLRLGQGEQELATDLDFSRQGRVNAMLVRRLELLSEVECLARSLQLPEDVAYTCETAGYFWLLHVYSRWEQFLAACTENKDKPTFIQDRFPFKEFFSNTPNPIFTGQSFEKDMRAAKGCFRHLKTMFQELEECRAFELLKSTVDRSNYLMTKQAKIVAMTCTHAALKRKDFLHLGFKYDNLLMEESAQILEIETFIPMLLQRQEDGYARLKRCILIGDHHQLPPVVKNMAFQKYSHMDQSLFTRFVRLGIPYIELNAQGRARPSLAQLYNWRYKDLGDLPYVREKDFFRRANAGFSFDYQLVDVSDYQGRGETAPSPWFYQNEGEAEYVVSVYIYMRLLGYPANKISILTTYNGQKLLIRDVINRRCVPYDFIGPPHKVTTVDKFQGQQNDFVLLSLVRTRFVGHLRDVRRLIVAMSRARLGLYVFCRRSLFEQCYELQPTFQLLLQRPDHLALNLLEVTAFTDRHVEDTGPVQLISGIDEMAELVNFRMHQVYEHRARLMSHQSNDFSTYPGQTSVEADNSVENGVADAEASIGTVDVEMQTPAYDDDRDVEMHASENGDDKDTIPDGKPTDPIGADVSPKEDGGVVPE